MAGVPDRRITRLAACQSRTTNQERVKKNIVIELETQQYHAVHIPFIYPCIIKSLQDLKTMTAYLLSL